MYDTSSKTHDSKINLGERGNIHSSPNQTDLGAVAAESHDTTVSTSTGSILQANIFPALEDIRSTLKAQCTRYQSNKTPAKAEISDNDKRLLRSLLNKSNEHKLLILSALNLFSVEAGTNAMVVSTTETGEHGNSIIFSKHSTIADRKGVAFKEGYAYPVYTAWGGKAYRFIEIKDYDLPYKKVIKLKPTRGENLKESVLKNMQVYDAVIIDIQTLWLEDAIYSIVPDCFIVKGRTNKKASSGTVSVDRREFDRKYQNAAWGHGTIRFLFDHFYEKNKGRDLSNLLSSNNWQKPFKVYYAISHNAPAYAYSMLRFKVGNDSFEPVSSRTFEVSVSIDTIKEYLHAQFKKHSPLAFSVRGCVALVGVACLTLVSRCVSP